MFQKSSIMIIFCDFPSYPLSTYPLQATMGSMKFMLFFLSYPFSIQEATKSKFMVLFFFPSHIFYR